MASPFLGEISLFGGNFNPRGWALCSGQILSIQQNSALFAILGTTYGGNGTSTFALPDFRGRLPVGQGQGPGLTLYTLGEQTGTEAVTLLGNQIAAHTHTLNGTTVTADSYSPGGNIAAVDPSATKFYGSGAAVAMAPSTIVQAGGNQPHANIQPVLALTFIIALQGIFPSRN